MTDFLARRLPGMQVNDIQGSPFQADLTYRGYRASGLLGASQGLSVYLDGVRINEPFGDVVNWDMVPEFALQSLTVLPGANPSFGLNTLGGAIVLETVDGRSAEGLRAELGFGSRGRKRVEVGLGQRHANGWHSYLGGTVFDENGWRDHSPGRQALVLARIGRSDGGTDWSLGVLGGSATLVGNGLLPSVTLDDGEALEAVRGRLMTGKSAVMYPGQLPTDPARLLSPARQGAEHWLDADYGLMEFAPARMALRPGEGPPHIRLDRAAEFLFGDRL